MMKQTIIFLFLLLSLMCQAQQRDVVMAEQIARDYLSRKGASAKQMALTLVDGEEQYAKVQGTGTGKAAVPYYVFNSGAADGFVIVSGDERMLPILGYAEEGAFTTENMPPALGWLLAQYAEAYEKVQAGEATPAAKLYGTMPATAPSPELDGLVGGHLSYRKVEPLITTKWNQQEPYNKFTPLINGKYSYTGCVATALAQLMFYYRYPVEKGQGVYSYTTPTLQIPLTADFSDPKYYQWDAMQDDYTGITNADAKADAVSNLMYACGVALSMDYEEGGSGTSCSYIPYVAHKMFGYNANAQFCTREYFSGQQWYDLLYRELQNNRPVVYSGTSESGGGHAFLLDGVADSTLFHVNWGWGGHYNAYYSLDALGNSVVDMYNKGQMMVIQLTPEECGRQEYMFVAQGFSFENTLQDPAKLAPFYLNGLINYSSAVDPCNTEDMLSMLYGVAIYDNDWQLVDTMLSTQYKQFAFLHGFHISSALDLNDPSSLAPLNEMYLVPVVVDEKQTISRVHTPNGESDYLRLTRQADGMVLVQTRKEYEESISPTGIDGVYSRPAAATTGVLHTITGQRISRDRLKPGSIYIDNGRKYWVK